MSKPDIETRLDNIEELLKLLLVNSVLESGEMEKAQESLLIHAREILSPMGYNNFRLYFIEREFYIFVEIEPSDSLSRIRRNYYQAADMLDGIRIVLTFNKLHPRRKKSFEDSKISYYIQDDEMRIFR